VNIIIVGGGRVGSTLAGGLARDGHDVSLVERSRARVRELSEALDVRLVEGNGSTVSALRSAGIEDASIVVATTDSDEVNFVVGQLAAALYKVPRIVVRLRDPDHEASFSALSRDHAGEHVCINPEAAAVDHILSLLEVPGAFEVGSFMDGQLLVAGFRIDESSDFAGLTLPHVQLMFADRATLVAAIHRGEEWIIPDGEEEIHSGDLVYFAIVREDLEGVLTLVGAFKDERRQVMIAGATRIGLELARRLEGRHQRVKLIEENLDLAIHASESLAETLVVHGPVTNQALLEEEEIDRVSTFVAVTPDHEENLVSGLLAKRLGAGRSFAMVDNPALATFHLFGGMGIDAIISPRLLAVGLIQQNIGGAPLRSVAALLEERVEVLEVEAEKGGRLTAGPLADVALPRGVLVAALRRKDKLMVPRGGDRVEAGDRVLVIARADAVPKLTAYLSP
jgi:trk system potassium uptake protein TrkA